jgi:hypothetical protein
VPKADGAIARIKHLLRFGHVPNPVVPNLKTEGNSVYTEGLTRIGQADLAITVGDPDLVESAREFLIDVNNYIASKRVRILPGETMPYGTWLVKFVQNERGLLEPWEVGSDPARCSAGMDRTLRDFRDQIEVCKKIGCEYVDTAGDLFATMHTTLTRIGVMVRTRAPYEKWSGWSFYSSDRRDEAHEHERLYTILERRPELARYLAVPAGFTIELNPERIYRADERN